MAVPFLESKLYLKLFPLERIFDDLCAQATDLWTHNGIPSCGNAERIDVVSIGFGMGARDVAVMLGLATALGADGPSIHVLAIDPAVDQVGIAQDRSFLVRSGFAVSPKDPNVWIRSRDGKRASVQIELTNLTAERWLRAKRLECAPRWDIVLACAVIHLLVDWKDTLGQFLSDLKPQGVLVFAEATGTVGVFEGDFRSGVNQNDPWEMLWHTVSQVREDLLIPAAKRVAPGNMSFLCQVLGDLGYERLQRSHGEPFIDAQCDQGTTVAEVIELIESVVGGPHARTLGALRILDVERAAEFVRCVREKLSPPAFMPEQKLTFRTGTRLHALRRPVASVSQHFAVAVARSALLRAQGEASELKAAIKESLGEVRRETGDAQGATTPLRSEQAIAALLYDMREILALSRDTLMVIARRSGNRYTEAFQVPPASLLGANSEESPEKYIRSMTVYTAADASRHLSQFLDEEGIGDITVRIDICPDDEIEDGRHLDLDAQYAVNGSPSSLYLRLSESIVRTAKASVQANPLFMSGSTSKYSEKYEGCARDGSFTRFYLTPDINGLRSLIRGENRDVVSPDVSIDNPTDIQKAIEDRVDVLFAVPPHLSPEHLSWRKELKSRLPSLLFHTLRLSWVEWRRAEDDLPPWRTCFYFARKNAHRTEERLGVGLLLLLPKSDQQAWPEGRHTEAQCGFGVRPPLTDAAEPFLAAIQEIRATELAAASGGERGVRRQIDAASHEHKQVLEFIFSVFLNQDLGSWFDISIVDSGKASTDASPDVTPSSLGSLLVPRKLAQEIKKCRLVPSSDMLDAARWFLFLWAEGRDLLETVLYQADQEVTLANLLRDRLVARAVRVAVLTSLRQVALQSYRDWSRFESTWRTRVSTFEGRVKLILSEDASRFSLRKPPVSGDNNSIAQTRFLRAIVSMITNAFKNTDEVMTLTVTAVSSSNETGLRVTLLNPRRNGGTGTMKNSGTLAVLELCAEEFGSRCVRSIRFTGCDSTGNAALERGTHWLTEIVFPVTTEKGASWITLNH